MEVKGTLVIGFGNTIRTDDNAGIWIAEQLSAHHLSGVVIETRHQLSLDLLEEFHLYSRILFIDAALEGAPYRFQRVGPPAVKVPPSAHHLTPADLVGMYEKLYGQEIAAFFCTVRGENFEFGTELSPETLARAERAVTELATFLQSS